MSAGQTEIYRTPAPDNSHEGLWTAAALAPLAFARPLLLEYLLDEECLITSFEAHRLDLVLFIGAHAPAVRFGASKNEARLCRTLVRFGKKLHSGPKRFVNELFLDDPAKEVNGVLMSVHDVMDLASAAARVSNIVFIAGQGGSNSFPGWCFQEVHMLCPHLIFSETRASAPKPADYSQEPITAPWRDQLRQNQRLKSVHRELLARTRGAPGPPPAKWTAAMFGGNHGDGFYDNCDTCAHLPMGPMSP